MKKGILVGFLLCSLLFIWGNSILPAKLSNAISGQVTQLLKAAIVHLIKIQPEVPAWVKAARVRKAAHVVEFGCFGILLTLYLSGRTGERGKLVRLLCAAGLLVALLDETIQLFNDRTSSVKDIWIDFSGFLIGCAIIFALKSSWIWVKKCWGAKRNGLGEKHERRQRRGH